MLLLCYFVVELRSLLLQIMLYDVPSSCTTKILASIMISDKVKEKENAFDVVHVVTFYRFK